MHHSHTQISRSCHDSLCVTDIQDFNTAVLWTHTCSHWNGHFEKTYQHLSSQTNTFMIVLHSQDYETDEPSVLELLFRNQSCRQLMELSSALFINKVDYFWSDIIQTPQTYRNIMSLKKIKNKNSRCTLSSWFIKFVISEFEIGIYCCEAVKVEGIHLKLS